MLSESQIQEILKRPKNSKLIDRAIDKQKVYRHFYCFDTPTIAKDEAKNFDLSAKKLEVFENVHKNNAQSLIKKFISHYSSVNEAFGKNVSFSFGKNVKAEISFKDVLSSVHDGISFEEYWSGKGDEIIFAEPNSVYLTGVKNGKKEVSRIRINNIYDIEANQSGIEYVVVLENIETEKEAYKRFYIYDDVYRYIYRESGDKYILEVIKNDDEVIPPKVEHKAGKCPAEFASNIDEDPSNNHIVKVVPYEDSIPDIWTYNLFKTFYKMYQSHGAFGIQVSPQIRCDYRDTITNTRCNDGVLAPLIFSEPSSGIGSACPSCSVRVAGKAGGEYVIPINSQGDEAYLKNIPNLYHRIDFNSENIQTQIDHVQNLKYNILKDVNGEGFGGSSDLTKNKTATEVQMSNSNMESILDDYGVSKAKTMRGILQCLGNMHSDSFESITYEFGNQYFLKSEKELYAELKESQDTHSNYAAIKQKQREIFLTKNKGDEVALIRYDRMDALKPFSTISPDFIDKHIDFLSNRYAKEIDMYLFFDQLVSIWELENGNMGSWGINSQMTESKIVLSIKQGLEKIFNENLKVNGGERGRGEDPRDENPANNKEEVDDKEEAVI